MIHPSCTKQMLYQLYVTEKRSYRYIFKTFNFNNARTLKDLLIQYAIPIRTRSEAIATQWIGNTKRKKQASKIAKKYLVPRLKGNRLSEETKKKISESRLGEKNGMYGRRGSAHHHYLGGKNSWSQGRKIEKEKKRKLREQLGNQCIRCRTTENLTINHKIPWRIVRHHEVWNLELLCKKCHFSGPNRDR